jgi:6-phosphogluconolactonase
VDVPANDSAGVFDEKDNASQRPCGCALIILYDFAILILLYDKRLQKTANIAQITQPDGIIYYCFDYHFMKGLLAMSLTKQKKPNTQIVANADALAHKCLDLFVASVEQTLKQKDAFYLAISGGHSPQRFFELLGSEQKALSLGWDKIHLFWVDERYVPHDSPHSNYKLAIDTFLTKIPIPEKNIHPIPTDDEDFDSAARQYEKTLRSVFHIKSGQLPKFDLVILGMGSDGHTGSLFPNSNACFDTNDLACVVYLLDQKLPDELLTRITLTHPVICAASQIAVLVSGPEKAKTLKEVLAGPPDEIRYPIHVLWSVLDKVLWLIDSPAASLI